MSVNAIALPYSDPMNSAVADAPVACGSKRVNTDSMSPGS